MALSFGGSGGGSVKPLDWQREPIRDIYARYGKITDKRINKGPYKGDTYAGTTDLQRDAFAGMRDFVNGQQGVAGALTGAAQPNIAAGANFGNNASDLFARYSQDPTGAIIGNAGQYMDQAGLQDQIDAVGRDISRNFAENDVLAANDEAAGGGGMNSRSEVARQMQLRDSQDRFADYSASMRGAAREAALDRSSNNYFQGAQTALDANRGVGAAGEMGANLAQSGLAFNSGMWNGALSAGAMEQGINQGALQDAYNRWNQKNGGFAQDELSKYYGLVGSTSWGNKMDGGDGSLGTQLLGGALTMAPYALGAAFGGPAGLMATLGAGGAAGGGSAFPTTWSSYFGGGK